MLSSESFLQPELFPFPSFTYIASGVRFVFSIESGWAYVELVAGDVGSESLFRPFPSFPFRNGCSDVKGQEACFLDDQTALLAAEFAGSSFKVGSVLVWDFLPAF